MPDSTFVARYPGFRDAPVIQFDDNAEFSDVYALIDYKPADGSNVAVTGAVSDCPGTSPNNDRFDDLSPYQINLFETDRDTTPANTSVPADGLYQDNPNAGTTGSRPDPLADHGDVFGGDDPEDLGHADVIL